MAYSGKTSTEINLIHIKKTLKKLKSGEIEVKDCGLNRRFEKLKGQSLPWYEDLYPEYINTVKNLNQD